MTITYNDHIAGETKLKVDGAVDIRASFVEGLIYILNGLEVNRTASQMMGSLMFTDESFGSTDGHFTTDSRITARPYWRQTADLSSYYSRNYGD